MYQITKIHNKERKVIDSNLTLQQANALLEEYHTIEECTIGHRPSPIVTLRSTTMLNSFVVDHSRTHTIYQIEEDVFNDICNLLKN